MMAQMASTASSDNGLARHESGLSSVPSEILQEQAIGRNGQSQLASNAYQRMIEQKEQELRESIMANYNHIREVEKELSGLSIQLQVNVGPRKHALELLRARIEKQNVHVSKVRAKYNAAKQAFLALEAELETEEAKKEQLCNELSLLVQESATAQLAKLEELKQHLDHLAIRRAGTATAAATPTPVVSNGTAENGTATSNSQLSAGRVGDPKSQQPQNVVDVQASSAASRSQYATGGEHTKPSATSASGNQPVQPVSEQQKLLAEVAAARTRKAQQMDKHTTSTQQSIEAGSRQAGQAGNVMGGQGHRQPSRGGLGTNDTRASSQAQGGKFSGFDV